MAKMNYISVCSGIEAASVAWHDLGWKALSFSEIEPFPCSVLKHRFPDVPNYGDMTRFEEWKYDETVDLLVGGTPCQSFSIAGLRGGLDDQRGNLALTYCRILQKFRPRWFVWENVPGVLSSNGGRDFGSILGAMAELGYGISYRILDAQFLGVPQRRRRVFVVGHLGDWRRSAEVLFERGCLSGNTKKGGKTGKEVAGTIGARTCRSVGSQDAELGHLVAYDLLGKPATEIAKKTVTHTPLRARIPGQVENSTVTVIASTGDKSHCLNAGGMGRQDYETETMVVFVQNQRQEVRVVEKVGALASCSGTHQQAFLSSKIGVRRLMPIECERLQGFPDNWTLVPHRGKPAADGPRYKAIGNSMAVPVMSWIGQRINMVDNNLKNNR